MLGVGFSEIIIIALVCFIALGPKQLPIVMRKIAGFYRQLAQLRDEFKFQLLSADRELKDDYLEAKNKIKELPEEKKHG
ncbi:MAG: hypothetical protein KC505_07310 [Myxococcales bacterium]|nr:hypothetical protein [Myxococcales bacterium]USN50428.1 MAG: hypothetical protein H6731_09225 [Myxococcales bacterium]